MELAEFIRTNEERIAADWQAAACPPHSGRGALSLACGHRCAAMIEAVARDVADASGSDSTVQMLREVLRSGEAMFDPVSLTSELQALKAAVIEPWMAQHAGGDHACRDLLRLHRAIDGAIAEAVTHCKEAGERSRNAFLALLGHDLRSPLAAIAMAAHYLDATGLPDEKQRSAVGSIGRGAAIMKALIRDMVEFSRSVAGGSIPVSPEPADLEALCRSAIAEVKATHPDCEFLLDAGAGMQGTVDRTRMHQLILNLLHNAVRHGTRRMPVEIALRREGPRLALSVTNHGPAIPAGRLPTLFDPLLRMPETGDAAPGHLGLGLVIAREIALAHKGEIAVDSSDEEGTTFTVRLPAA